MRATREISTWEKNPYRLLPVPEGVTDAFRESFEKAMGWAEEGLWASAASAFELLSAGSSAGAAADRNRGLCCLWIADAAAGIAALRRYIARTGPTADAVDLEALCQVLEGDRGGETVEFVHLTWPIRDRAGLLQALEAGPYFVRGRRATHPPRRPGLVPDRRASSCWIAPGSTARPGLTRRDIPMAEGEVIVGENSVVLETYDDSRLNRLIDRFTAAAGATIPPAHPRTKVIEKVPRYVLAMSWQWSLPAGPPGRGCRSGSTASSGPTSSARSGPRRPTRPCGGRTPIQAAPGRRRRDGPPRRDPPAGGRRARTRATCSTGTRSAPRLGLTPEPAVDASATSTSTGCTCRDGR